MTTPLVVLALLAIPVILFAALAHVDRRGQMIHRGGILGLSLTFAFFALGHFVQTSQLADMLPPWVPLRVFAVYVTGVLEVTLAVALLVKGSRWLAGWSCIALLVAFFPVNVYAAFHQVGPGGHIWGPAYLLVRAPMQLILIGWCYWFAIRNYQSRNADKNGGSP